MKKDEFHRAAQEQNNQTPAAKKDTAAAASSQVRIFQPPAPNPLVPKPPFGMPMMPVAKNIKVINPGVPPKKDKDVDLKEPDLKE